LANIALGMLQQLGLSFENATTVLIVKVPQLARFAQNQSARLPLPRSGLLIRRTRQEASRWRGDQDLWYSGSSLRFIDPKDCTMILPSSPTPTNMSKGLRWRRLARRFRMYQRLDATEHFPADQALTQTHGVRGEVAVGEHHHKQLADSIFPHLE
jgi:hypothetical protein